MIAATEPVQRPASARLLVVREDGSLEHHARAALASVLRADDLVIANDAATLPASLRGEHLRTGATIEVRLAARRALDPRDATHYRVVLFGEGDHTTRTEDRARPPEVRVGDRLALAGGALMATITAIDHPRLVDVRFDGATSVIWEALARHGRPVQYAHVRTPLRLWDVWTPIAGPPVAVEPPSAGFVLDFRTLGALSARGIEIRFLTHAAGLSSTGDPALDVLLPLDEPYEIPASTASAIRRAKAEGRRVVAIGTTVVRALEASAAEHGAVHAGPGLATIRLGPERPVRVVDAILSGTHERGTSHHALLSALTSDEVLARADDALDAHAYRTHEFGDSCLVEAGPELSAAARARSAPGPLASASRAA